MTKKIGVFLLIAFLIGGCSGLTNKNKGTIGKESQKTSSAIQKLEGLNQDSFEVNNQRLTSIGAFSSGVDYSLQKDTNQSQYVLIARELNEKIAALANKPDYKDLQAIYQIVDTLITNQANGEKLLAAKDKEIYQLNNSIHQIENNKNKQINDLINQAEKNAAKADQYKSTLEQMDSFWGGGAIWYGFKKGATKLIWFGSIGLLLYIILRAAANFSPIASTLFSIIDTIFSIFIKLIQSIAPKAVYVAGFIERKIFEDYRGTLKHVIDAVQSCKEKEKLGIVVKMDDVMIEADRSMDEVDRDRVREIKRELNWK